MFKPSCTHSSIIYTLILITCIIYSLYVQCHAYVGIVYVYGVMQLNMWAMFHAISLCWGIVFPFHFRLYKAVGRIKYIHITTVIIALLVPLIPALLYLKDGYAALFTPTRVCTGRSLKVTYFAFLLPTSIILAMSTFALAIVFWTILKVCKSVIVSLASMYNYYCCLACCMQ